MTNSLDNCPSSGRRQIGVPVFALAIASMVSVALLTARIAWTGHWRHVYLAGNLLLAWLPLLFAMMAWRLQAGGRARSWRFVAVSMAWLVFFPNAPYIFTDLVHAHAPHEGRFWVDLVLILLFALTGLLLGFVSLNRMQTLGARRFGWVAGWAFAAGVAGLSGFGIYLGRFLRWNSWDILLNPAGLSRDVGAWLIHPPDYRNAVVFPALFATFLFLAQLMLQALTHLKTDVQLPPFDGEKRLS